MKSTLILAIWLAANAWAQNLPPKRQGNPPAAVKLNSAPSTSQAPRNVQIPPGLQSRPLPKAPPAQPSRRKVGNSDGFVMNPRRTPSTSAVQSSSRERGSRHRAQPFARRISLAKNGKAAPKGERDPFVSPIVKRKFTPASCTGSGRQCLVVSDITLNGVVRSPSGFIAVVVNGERTYFLRKDDPLADGAVAKITWNTITLRQRSSDAVGRPLVREVTKKLGAPAG